MERLQCELCVEFRLNSEIVAFVLPAFGKDTPNGTLVLHRRLKGEWSEGILLGEARQLTILREEGAI